MLISPRVADEFVDSCNLTPTSRVLEIGTGDGIITKRLAEKAGFVLSIEIDPDLYQKTRTELSSFRNLELVCSDAFTYNLKDRKFDCCITSLPYSESLRFSKWLAERSNLFLSTSAIVQSEFASKLIAIPGHSSFRAISVITQISFNIQHLFAVDRKSFAPSPRVQSDAIRFTPNNQFQQPYFNEKRMRVIDFIFSFRGRKLSSVLKKLDLRNLKIRDAVVAERVEKISPLVYSTIIQVLEAATF